MKNSEIQQMIQALAKLPGLGSRSARRIALHLLKHKDQKLHPLIDTLSHTARTIQTCGTCFNLDTTNPCALCQDHRRDQTQLCVVADVADLWALERSQAFRGLYHILGGVLSALDGRGPSQLTIEALVQRVGKGGITEVVLALNATVDGQTTIHYLADHLKSLGVTVSTLAHGVPMGGELDYLDEGTLSTALASRHAV